MQIYTTIKIGDFHTNHCEDYLITAEAGKHKLLCAVMDGCSMGNDSYFAATLTGKILRKIAKGLSYKEFISKQSEDLPLLLENVTSQLFHELRSFKSSIQLEWDEILNTVLISVIDTANCAGEFLCIGDGLICINGALYEFEQNNRPDYLGYHLDKDFKTWYVSQKQRISAQEIKDFSIATDGIFTFKKFDNKVYRESDDVIEWLLLNTEGHQSTGMLDRKLLEIESDWGLRPTDDLAVIRGIIE